MKLNLNSVFKSKKPIIAMVQTAAFPRSFRSRGLTMDQVIESAVTDALLLEKAGVDGLLLQDLGQLPRRDTVDIVDVARFSIVCSNVTNSVGLPIGINCVWNAWIETLAIATAVEALFVRFKTYVGASLTPFGLINGCAA
ncbi:MAG: BtpA/SgcQ family protein, partial [Anaerolineaceae bacterium]